MDALKALAGKLKKEASQVAGDRKFVKKGEIVEARLKKIREEEEEERKEKDKKRKLASGEQDDASAAELASAAAQLEEPSLPSLDREEVKKRLRALGQPVTLFGEEDYARLKRLLKAEKEMTVVDDDEIEGGHATNSLIALQREAKLQKKQPRNTQKAEADKAEADKAARGAGGDPEKPGGGDGAAEPEENPTLAAFKRAAAELADRRAEESMATEERIAKYLKQWSKEWEEDLERRPEDVKDSGSGRHATLLFRQTMQYLEPLYHRLKYRLLHEDLMTGLWMIVEAMRDRNYLHANDIYLKLAIGNAPWPIGVTSVGIHERSAREKISHSMNSTSQAHIMNDEASRKFLQVGGGEGGWGAGGRGGGGPGAGCGWVGGEGG